MANLTEQQMIDANRGYWDGQLSNSKGLNTHTNWPAGPHFNADYERGYWTGFINGSLPHPDSDFAAAA